MPRPKNSFDGRDQFCRHLQEKENSVAKHSLEYLIRKGRPEDALVTLLEIAVTLDTVLPSRTLEEARRDSGVPTKQIKTSVRRLREVADLMERLDRESLAVKADWFGRFPQELRKAANLLAKWRPVELNSRVWFHPLYVTYCVNLAVPSV